MGSLRGKWRLVGLLAMAIAAPGWAQPITIAPGNDGWVTVGTTQVDLAVFPIDDFFGPGSVVNPQVVTLNAAPLAPALGSIDTLLVRYPPSVTFNAIPETRTFQVEMKALRLHGNVAVNGTSFQLTVTLSSTPPGPGTITATRLTPDGGRFNSSFPVLPKLVFIEVGNLGNRVDIDCAVANCPTPLILGAANVCWEVAFGPNGFDPATKGLTPIAAGIAVDGDFDGVNDYVTVGRKQAGFPGLEFHQGYDPTPPWLPCPDVTHSHAVYSLSHRVEPPTDCAATTSTASTLATKALRCSCDYCLRPDFCPISCVFNGKTTTCKEFLTVTLCPSGLKEQPARGRKISAWPQRDKPRQ